VGTDRFRADVVYDDGIALYGGQVAAQALVAAGRTVDPARPPHSLHCYFLRAGDPAVPTEFGVERDRDGRSFSARRVTASQGGRVVLSMVCSFAVREDGPEQDVDPMPPAGPPEAARPGDLPRLFDMEARYPAQPFPDGPWPTRVWARTTVPLPPDPLLHASVLTYLSDLFTGTAGLAGAGRMSSTTLDHALWFHRPSRLDDWVLMDLTPRTAAGGRGWYTGTVHDSGGRLAASMAQEVLVRSRR
jgi:acyl-CoA thioesterase-2